MGKERFSAGFPKQSIFVGFFFSSWGVKRRMNKAINETSIKIERWRNVTKMN